MHEILLLNIKSVLLITELQYIVRTCVNILKRDTTT